ncbi:MAG: M48 family metalloprotease [Chroococcidiopsidaceae cyanobacterium CP_BM_ER_R8_30]|nr:M48 family metalloprotease [Chroococcidiopsidaceae cyanobacterium CP_BM_ER_R8_30]
MVRLYYRRWHRLLSFFIGLGIALGLGVAPVSASILNFLPLLIEGNRYIQLSNVSPQQEVKLGQEINQQLHQQYKFDTNSQENAYVNRVGQRVASVSDCAHKFPFHFYVVKDPAINAFSTTGGFVYVDTGLLKAVNNESELAGVLGHEIGHICNNDLIHRMRQVALEQGIATATGVSNSTLVGLGTQLAVNLPNSRQDELNADAKGQKYLERAGYNPYGLVDFLKKLLREPSQPAFLSDHPGTKERIAVLEKKIASRNQG